MAGGTLASQLSEERERFRHPGRRRQGLRDHHARHRRSRGEILTALAGATRRPSPIGRIASSAASRPMRASGSGACRRRPRPSRPLRLAGQSAAARKRGLPRRDPGRRPFLTPTEFPQIASHLQGRRVEIPPLPMHAGRPPRNGSPQASASRGAIPTPFRSSTMRATCSRSPIWRAQAIRFALAHYHGHMSAISRHLGIGRSTLYRKLKELGLER